VKYLCLIFLDEKKLAAMSAAEAQALDDVSLAYDQTLRENGHLLAAQALRPVNDAVTVRARDGKVTVTDGPFAETKEQVGGFILIEAKYRSEAIRIAGKIPVARFGSIEVRPIKELTASADLRRPNK
jgi:hypothetical protein